MSRVYFHSPSGTAELLGRERAHAGVLIGDLSVSLANPGGVGGEDAIRALLPPDHYLHAVAPMAWDRAFATAWRVELTLNWRGHELDAWTMGLNTALLLGNDAVKFLARMHGSCEIHGWVDGPNRAWLADIIHGGQVGGLYREGVGWDEVAAHLRRRDDEPVVMSYSVCDSFPNSYASGWQRPEGAEDSEGWYDLPESEQWELSLRWLRSQPGLLQMRPETWEGFRFGDGLTALDLAAPDRDERFAAALFETVAS